MTQEEFNVVFELQMRKCADILAHKKKEYTGDNIAGLPHPTVQKFMVITVAVVGASRRFLAQITRHQNEVKYMSASLQYSNYSGLAAGLLYSRSVSIH